MKRFISLIFVIALAVIHVPWLHPAGAADKAKVDVYQNQKLVKSVVFAIGMDEYFVNGQTPGVKMDAVTFLENGRTFVPVRYLGKALGLADQDITWDNDKNKATLKGKATLEMIIGKPEIVTNGQAKAIDVAPVLKSVPAWRTYLPARFVAEGLGYQVDWDEATQTVICYPKDEPKPDVSAVQQYVKESAAKPEAVKELERVLGVVSKPSPNYKNKWYYEPSREEINSNKDISYFTFTYRSDDDVNFVYIKWNSILPNIDHVQLDLSPLEKVLTMRFPGHDAQVQEIIAKAQQMAEKRRDSNGFKNDPPAVYRIGDYEVGLTSMEMNFVTLAIQRKEN